ncbi:MAG: hypothetical protein ACTSR1_00270 [Candidatus Heimdallarchaeota archaeon]
MSFSEGVAASDESAPSSVDTNQNDVSQNIETNVDKDPNSGWYINKSGELRGDGDKPEWLKEKYGDVFKQAEAYPHAERKISELTSKLKELQGDGADIPAEYEFNIPEEFNDLIDDDDLIMGEFTDEVSNILKESKIDQPTFDKVSHSFLKFLDGYYQDAQKHEDSYIKSEIEKIGPDAKKQFAEMQTWIGQNHPTVDAEKLLKNIPNADFFMELKKMRDGSPSSGIPTSNNSHDSNESYDQLKKNLLDPRIRTDSGFRRRTMDGYKRLFGNN